MCFGPLDKICNDQEISGITHLDDNAEFKVKALFIIFKRKAIRHAHGGKPVRQTFPRLVAQFLRLVTITETRQDRRMPLDDISAALGDLDSILDGLGNIRK